jgi:hypothetical protein
MALVLSLQQGVWLFGSLAAKRPVSAIRSWPTANLRLRRAAVTRPARSRLASESIGEFNNSP